MQPAFAKSGNEPGASSTGLTLLQHTIMHNRARMRACRFRLLRFSRSLFQLIISCFGPCKPRQKTLCFFSSSLHLA